MWSVDQLIDGGASKSTAAPSLLSVFDWLAGRPPDRSIQCPFDLDARLIHSRNEDGKEERARAKKKKKPKLNRSIDHSSSHTQRRLHRQLRPIDGHKAQDWSRVLLGLPNSAGGTLASCTIAARRVSNGSSSWRGGEEQAARFLRDLLLCRHDASSTRSSMLI